jgi:hypothetical protein
LLTVVGVGSDTQNIVKKQHHSNMPSQAAITMDTKQAVRTWHPRSVAQQQQHCQTVAMPATALPAAAALLQKWAFHNTLKAAAAKRRAKLATIITDAKLTART